MHNILIINVHSLKNAGDAALSQVTIDQVKSNFPQSNITLILDDPDPRSDNVNMVSSLNAWLQPSTSNGRTKWSIFHLLMFIPATLIPLLIYRLFNFRFLYLTPGKLHNLLNSYIDADIIISQPGGFLYSSGRGFVLLTKLYSLGMALIAGKPLYLFPQSFGPFFQKWEKRVVQWTLSGAQIIMAREPESYNLLNSIGIPESTLLLIPDLAFAYQGKPKTFGEKWLKDHGVVSERSIPLLGITVINWSAENKRFLYQDEYESAIASATRFFIEHHAGIAVFFTQVRGPSMSQDDRIPTRRVIDQLRNLSESVIFIEDPLPPDALKSIYGCMDIFIGTRMHSNIFALGERVPVIAIGYQHKTRGTMQMLDLEEWTLEITDLKAEQLISKLSSLWNGRKAVQEKLSKSVPHLVDQAGQVGKILLKNFSHLQEHTS
jgi:colanic acid/amylovoran biosynthesis protein